MPLQSEQVFLGLRVAVLAFGKYDRAEIISTVNSSGYLKVFFIDFGTTGFVQLKNCKTLIEEFGKVSKKAIRASLYGIRPKGNKRLWDLDITMRFIDKIREKIHRIRIVKHHEKVSQSVAEDGSDKKSFQEDYYEFLLYDGDSLHTLNEMMVTQGAAEQINESERTACAFYPSFNMLERQIIYPTFSERVFALEKHGISFNDFEEKHISAVTSTTNFQKELEMVLVNADFAPIKKMILDNMFGATNEIF